MKVFCAYAYTGEDIAVVTERMKQVVDTLQAGSHEAYCDRFDDAVNQLLEKDDVRGVFERTFEKVDQCDAVVAIVVAKTRSIGQLMEIGVALHKKKPVYLFEHVSAQDSSYLPRLADKTFSWESTDSLLQALRQL